MSGIASLIQSYRELPRFFHKVIWISLAVKLVLSTLLPLTSDEAYYWVWSHHMQWSYLDHPPVIAWLFWLTHPLENFGGACRWAGVVMSQLTLCVWLVILRSYLTEVQLRMWLWLVPSVAIDWSG